MVHTTKCKYCEVRLPNSDATKIPKNKEQLAVWIEILGPKFAENIKNSKSNYICMSHIENGDRSHFRLPKNVNNVILVNSKPRIKKTNIEKNRICRYCEVSGTQNEMTRIPKIPELLSKWIDILGPEFSKNIKTFKHNWICLKHIENRSRGPHRIPKKNNDFPTLTTDNDDGMGEKHTPNKIVEENNRRRSERLKQRNQKVSCIVDKDIDIEENDEEKEYSRNQDTVSIHQELVKIPNISGGVEKIDKEQNPAQKQKEHGKRNTKISPKISHKTSRSLNNLAETNDEDVNKIQKPVVQIMEVEDQECMEVEYPNSGELFFSQTNEIEPENPSNPIAENLNVVYPDQDFIGIVPKRSERLKSKNAEANEKIIEEQAQKMEEQDYDCFEMLPPKSKKLAIEIIKTENDSNIQNFQLKNEETIQPVIMVVAAKTEDCEMIEIVKEVNSTERPGNSIVNCRVCEIRNEQKMMTEIPTDSKILEKWVKNLDSSFVKSMSQNPPPHFVCFRHVLTLLNQAYTEE